VLDRDLAGVLADIREDLDENDLAEVFLAGPAGEMGADDFEDEGVNDADEVRSGPLILTAQPLDAGFHIEAGIIHGSINSGSTQVYDN
jgi:hypothetical protein